METIMLGQLGRFCVVQVTGRIILGLSVNKVIIIIIQVSWPTCLEKKILITEVKKFVLRLVYQLEKKNRAINVLLPFLYDFFL